MLMFDHLRPIGKKTGVSPSFSSEELSATACPHRLLVLTQQISATTLVAIEAVYRNTGLVETFQADLGNLSGAGHYARG